MKYLGSVTEEKDITTKEYVDGSIDENRPSINGVTLKGNKTSEDLGILPGIDVAYEEEGACLVFSK